MAENLRLRVILDLAERAVAPLKRISQGSKETAQALSATRKALRDLNAQQGAIERMRGLQQQLASTGQQIKSATVLLEQMRRATPATAAEQKNLARTIATAERELERLNGTADGQRQRLITLRRAMKEMGIAHVTEAEARLRTQIDATTRSMQRQQAQLSRLATLREAAASAAVKAGAAVGVGLGLQAVGRRGVDFGMLPVKDFASHEDAMLGIARQVPGARDAGGQLTDVYRKAETDVRDLSTKIPLATTEIAAMMTAAARMEVPVDQLKDFTLVASQIATAFDAAPDAITEAMGKVAKNFKIPLTEISGLADSINYLDDNAISKGADIIDFLNRTSGVVSTVAMSAKDAAALGSTLLTLGERTETASTATNAIVQKFAAATKGTKKFHSALKEIGLNDTAVQKGMATDAMGTLFKVIKAIKRLPKDKRIGVMVELVGMEHSDTLAKLIDKPEELIRQRNLTNGTGAQGSMAREAAARNATLSAQWAMAENRIFNLKSAIGESLKPALITLMNTLNPLLEATARWVKENSGLVSAVLKVVLVGSALMVLLGSVLVPLALIAGKFILLRYLLATFGAKLFGVGAGMRILYSVGYAAGRVFAFLVPVLSAVAAAMLRLGAVLLANPIVAIIALIAAAAFLIWQNWATIKAYLIAAWDALAAAATRWWTSLTSGGQAAWQYLVALKNQFFQAGADLMNGMVNGITSRLLAVRDAITGAADATVAWFKEKLDIQSPSRVFIEAGGYISEGAALGILRNQHLVRAASLAMAGAAMAASAPPGQAMTLPSIVQARAGTPGMGAGQMAGSSYQITVNAAPGMDPQAIALAVRAELDKRDRMARSRVLSQMIDNE
ncbi:phage tail tape measure protein [Verminephrobacter aporrectodeae subsp. tuberculatae]|uniref:Phage tail tape measure protein n=1 Tax=Verminephrobacter aporrectodeae subsp. tuberculatae TaxID=1110392 RepID=A0ABT3KQG7_9BURK|nr:phage tail tape measure protein [Verminephrobacter aporrectodeae]MCW5320559.1 phage tail tape measure protein [Verminephrobacter aporrectodeae subsp. tuberculatae]